MKSNKQRRQEIRLKRERRKVHQAEQARRPENQLAPPGSLPVKCSNLAPYNSYDEPIFVLRGWYEDYPFTCRDCSIEQVWTAAQQKWWYEVRQGQVYSRAIRCHTCRLNKRIRDGRAQPDSARLATQHKRVKA